MSDVNSRIGWRRPPRLSLLVTAVVGLGGLLVAGVAVEGVLAVVLPGILVGLFAASVGVLTAQETLVRRTLGLAGSLVTAFAIVVVASRAMAVDQGLVLLSVGSLTTGYGLGAAVTGALDVETVSTTTRRVFGVLALFSLLVFGDLLLARNGLDVVAELLEALTSLFLEPGRQPGDPAAVLLVLAVTVATVRKLLGRIDVETLLTPSGRERYVAFAGPMDRVAKYSILALSLAGLCLAAVGLQTAPGTALALPYVGAVTTTIIEVLYAASAPTVLGSLVLLVGLCIGAILSHSVVRRLRRTPPRRVVRAVVPPMTVTVALLGLLVVVGDSVTSILTSVPAVELLRSSSSQLGEERFVRVLALVPILAYGGILLVGTWAVRRGLLPVRASSSALASVGLFVACPAVVVLGQPTVVPVLTLAGLLLWDVGEHGTVLATETSSRVSSSRLELVHVGFSATVGLVLLAVVWVADLLVGTFEISPGHSTAIIALTGGTFVLLFYSIYLSE